MAVLSGYSDVTYMNPPGAQGANPGVNTIMPAIVDGTPVRVVVLALSGAIGLVILHAAGFRFNVGVSA